MTITPDITPANYYRIGGTVPRDAACYVERDADHKLYERLLAREYCYILTARQMGKSSLMVRIATRLREKDNVRVAVLDLTALGSNLSPEQWYQGQLSRIGRQLHLEDELDDYWFSAECRKYGPLQRWVEAFTEVILPACPDPLVLFIDEIDLVRSLRFSTDEYLAGIRECYNRRNTDPEFRRLTFCLIGVATPSDLMEDKRATPFNIARSIELRDFHHQEAAHLADGLTGYDRQKTASRLLERVLYWTGGHPYLTQRLCQAVAEDPAAKTPARVDACCERLFFTRSAQERDDNLKFVRDRLLFEQRDIPGLMSLYDQIRRGKQLTAKTDPHIDLLQLSGLCVADQKGNLRVRNRIYAKVFDGEWVRAQMPDAELKRQKAAYQQGLIRAGSAAALIIAVLAGLSFFLWRALAQVKSVRDTRSRSLYDTQLNLAQRALEENNVARAQQLLDTAADLKEATPGVNSFAWRYLSRLCHDELQVFNGNSGKVMVAALSADGKILLTATEKRRVTFWNRATKIPLRTLSLDVPGTPAVYAPLAMTFSPDQKIMAVGGPDNDVHLWNLSSGQKIRTLHDPATSVTALSFSRDGRFLATGTFNGNVRLWNVQAGQLLRTLTGGAGQIVCLSFSQSGKQVAAGTFDGRIQTWQADSGRLLWQQKCSRRSINALAFSPNEQVLAAGSPDRNVYLYGPQTGRLLFPPIEVEEAVLSLAISPDGRHLAIGTKQRTVHFCDLASGTKEERKLLGHTSSITTVAFSPDSKTLITGGADQSARLWNMVPQNLPVQNLPVDEKLAPPRWLNMALSDDGTVATLARMPGNPDVAEPDPIVVRDARTGNLYPTVRAQHKGQIKALALSSDGSLIAAGGDDHIAWVWDRKTCRLVHTFSDAGMYIIDALAFSADGHYLAIGDMWGTVFIQDLTTGRSVRRIAAPTPKTLVMFQSLAFAPDGKTLAIASDKSSSVSLVDVRDGKIRDGDISSLPVLGSEKIDVLSFSPDGKFLAGGTTEDTVFLWRMSSLFAPQRLKSHVGPVTALAFAPDSQTLVTGGDDGVIRIWDTVLGQEVMELPRSRQPICSLAFNPAGDTLISQNEDGRIRRWNP